MPSNEGKHIINIEQKVLSIAHIIEVLIHYKFNTSVLNTLFSLDKRLLSLTPVISSISLWYRYYTFFIHMCSLIISIFLLNIKQHQRQRLQFFTVSSHMWLNSLNSSQIQIRIIPHPIPSYSQFPIMTFSQ